MPPKRRGKVKTIPLKRENNICVVPKGDFERGFAKIGNNARIV